MPPSHFQTFGPDHQIVLALTLIGCLLLVRSAVRIRRRPKDLTFRWILILTLTVSGLMSWSHKLGQGINGLPLELCDLALIAVIGTLIRPEIRYLGEMGVLWALSGSVQAILTPDLGEGFPSLSFILFFLTHCGVVVSAVYVMARGHVVLVPASVLRVWLATNVYASSVGILNWRFGSNFGYLAAKPIKPSLLDYLGPWPYYIFWEEAIAFGLFSLGYGFSRYLESRCVRRSS